MDEPLVLISRLDELSTLTQTTSTIEKAAIYGATKAIQREFVKSKLSKNAKLIDDIKAACFYINATIGYESVTQKSKNECIKLAQLKLDNIRTTINLNL